MNYKKTNNPELRIPDLADMVMVS